MAKPLNPYKFGAILKFTQAYLQNREDLLSDIRLCCDMQFGDELMSIFGSSFYALRCMVISDPGGFYNYNNDTADRPNPVVYPMLSILERAFVITQTRRLTVRK